MPVLPVVTPSPNLGTHGYITIVDSQGYVIGSVASTDGALYQTISGESIFLYSSGGPVDVNGAPSLQTFDRLRSLQGKGLSSATISATGTSDLALACSSGAMKTVMPGQAIRLTGGVSTEYAYVSSTYMPVATASSIPLAYPLVITGNTTATWDTFNVGGPGLAQMFAVGLFSTISGAVNPAIPGDYRLLQMANSDALASTNVLAVAAVGYNGGATSERMRSPNVYKPFNAQAVTASSSNTPTSIWTPATGKKFRLMGFWFSTTAAAGLVFHDLAVVGSSGLLGIPSPVIAASGEIKSPPIGNGFLSATANNQLWIDATSATTLTGFVYGTEE